MGDLSELLLQGSSHGGNIWTVQDTFANPSFSGTVIETQGDTVNVLGTTGELQVLGFGGVDRVNVGGDPNTTAGTLANIHGQVDVDNLGGPRTQLIVNDRGDNHLIDSHLVNLDATAFQGTIKVITFGPVISEPAPITYTGSGVQLVQFLGSNASDSFFVLGTPTGTTVELFGGSGDDDFNVGDASNTLNEIRGLVFVEGGVGGSNSLTVDDSGAALGHSYADVPGFIERFGGSPSQVVVEYSNIQDHSLIQNGQPDPFPQARDLALPRHVRVGTAATLTGRLVDADPTQVLTLTVDWGDGSVPEQSTPDRGPFAVTHTYASPGVYTVHAIWSDSEGRSNGRDLTIRVGPTWLGADADLVDGLDAVFAQLGADPQHRGAE